jgi:chemotaxis protein CheY-P-specific phosphatase CheC
MNALRFSQTLNTVTADTLESLAMVFLVPEEDAPRSSGSMIRAGVTFTGRFNGSLELTVSSALLGELAENMLGLGESIDLDLQQDAVKEFSNVICGNILPAIGGVQEIFFVNAPSILTGSAVAHEESWVLAGKTRLFTEEGTMSVTLYTDPCALAVSDAA